MGCGARDHFPNASFRPATTIIRVLTGHVDQRTLDKYERESKELNRETWYLSWAMDTNDDERIKGITQEVRLGQRRAGWSIYAPPLSLVWPRPLHHRQKALHHH